jgi:hypothetical protein
MVSAMTAMRLIQPAIVSERATHTRAKRVCSPRVSCEPQSAGDEQKDRAHQRRQNREYMRRWRTSPENRAKEKRRFAGMQWQRKLERATQQPREGEIRNCAYCRQESVMRIDRLRPTENGFKKVELPYCGHC